MTDTPTCDSCGHVAHIHPWLCPYDLHGEGDWFKASCAVCETEIPSGADRCADGYGNLYCSLECKSAGLETLVEKLSQNRSTANEVTA